VNVKHPRLHHSRDLLATLSASSLPGLVTCANVGNLRAILVDVETSPHERVEEAAGDG
jgi:hypothetical protein